MFIKKLSDALKKAHIHYAIVGGYAVSLYGALRSTFDIVIEWELKNLITLEKTLQEMGLVSRLPIDANAVFYFRDEYIEKRNLIAWNFYDPKNPIHQVDLIICYNLKNHKIKKLKTSFGEVNLLMLQDLIAMKKASGRPQDLEDIKALENL